MLSLVIAHPIAAKQFLPRPATPVVIRCRRLLSSVPHHLARKNNSWVNGFVKSIKVPRPIIVANTAIPTKKSRIETTLHAAEEEEDQQSLGMCYVGNDNIPITNELKIVVPGVDDVPRGTWPVFRMMVS